MSLLFINQNFELNVRVGVMFWFR